MKKLYVSLFTTMMTVFVLVFSSLQASTLPQLFFDFNSDGVADTQKILEIGDRVRVDIWIGGWQAAFPGEQLFGADLYFYYDETLLKVNKSNSYANDTTHGGPFDPSFAVLNDWPGKIQLTVANFSCVEITDHLLLYTLEIECLAAGTSNIKIGVDYNSDPAGSVSNGGEDCLSPTMGDAYDGTATIEQVEPTTTTIDPPAHDITLSIGNGSGDPGSTGNPVEISLKNPVVGVKGFIAEICGDADYLIADKTCETTGRTEGLMFDSNRLPNGCLSIFLAALPGSIIEPGTGPVFIIKYDVEGDAPDSGCEDLDFGNVTLQDEFKNEYSEETLTLLSGTFCMGGSTPSTTSIPGGGSSGGPGATTTIPGGGATTTTTIIGGGDPSTTTTIEFPAPGDSTTTTTTTEKTEKCPIENILGSDNENVINVIRRFRDRRLSSTPAGLLLNGLYYMHGSEITDILMADRELELQARKLVLDLLPAIKKEGSIVLGRKQCGRIISLISKVDAVASPVLQETLGFILKKFASQNGFNSAGITIDGR